MLADLIQRGKYFVAHGTKKKKSDSAFVLSQVVGVLQIYYLLSCAGGWLSQHCCVVAKAILFEVSIVCFA